MSFFPGLDKYQPSRVEVENNTGSVIPAMRAVSLNGMGTEFVQIVLANPSTAPVFGITTHPIYPGTTGIVTTLGLTFELDTSPWPLNSSIYSDASGNLVTSPATYGDAPIAVVISRDIHFGILFINALVSQFHGAYGFLKYKGTLDASLGVYPAGPVQGDYYVISVAGTISGHAYAVGDWATYNGVQWDYLDNSSYVTSVNGHTGPVVLTKGDIGLSNVDNTSDANKPISNATQTALNSKEGTISPGTSADYYRGDKTWQTLNKAAVGLSNADNTSDVNKPISTATQTALNGKEPTLTASDSSKYYRGDKSWQTLDKSAVGLSNVDNTSDVNKPISSATQTALNGKEPTQTKGSITSSTPAVVLVNNVNSTVGPNVTIDVSNANNINSGLLTAVDKYKLDLIPVNQMTRESFAEFPRTMPGYPADGSPTYYPYAPSSVRLVGNYAYMLILANPGALAIFDISDKTNPIWKSTISLCNIQNNGPRSIFVEPTGRYAYVTMTSFNINIIDTLNKSVPVLVNVDTTQSITGSAPWGIRQGSVPAATFTPNAFGALNDVTVSDDGHWLYTVDVGASGANCGAGVFVFDLQNLLAPAQKWNISAAPTPGPMGTTTFTNIGPLYFTIGTTANNSIVMFSSSTDANVPTGVKLYVNSYGAGKCKLWTGSGGTGTEIIPAGVGSAVLQWRPIAIKTVGKYLYVVEFSNTNTGGTPNNTRLLIYDISNVATVPPVYVGSVTPPTAVYGATASCYGLNISPDGNVAYISTTVSAIFVVDCSNKAAPVVMSTIISPNGIQVTYPKGITIVSAANQFIWFTTISGGATTPAYLYDVSDKSNPVLVNQLNILGTISTGTYVFSNVTNLITLAGHGLTAGGTITFTTVPAGSGPNVVAGQTYYIVNTTPNTFQIALAPDGTPITLLASGNGTVFYVLDSVTSTITMGNHRLLAGEDIAFSAVPAGSGPNIATGQQYFIVNPTQNTFQLSLTAGGPPITLLASGNATLYSGTGHVYEYQGFLYVANRALNSLDIYSTLDYTEYFGLGKGSSLILAKSLTVAGNPVASYKTDWITADGTTKTITHKLGTLDVRVEVYDKTDGHTMLIDTVARTDANTVTLTHSSAPGAAGRRVLIGTV